MKKCGFLRLTAAMAFETAECRPTENPHKYLMIQRLIAIAVNSRVQGGAYLTENKHVVSFLKAVLTSRSRF
jgi:hypothetical protein